MRRVLSILLDDEQVQYLLVMKQLMANPSAQKWGGGKWIDNRHESILLLNSHKLSAAAAALVACLVGK